MQTKLERYHAERCIYTQQTNKDETDPEQQAIAGYGIVVVYVWCEFVPVSSTGRENDTGLAE